MAYIDRFRECNVYREDNKIPFLIDGKRVGKVLLKYKEYLLDSSFFRLDNDVLTLNKAGNTFIPKSMDGEVEEFYLMPIAEVADIVKDSNKFKLNCNLVIIDFLVRHGYLALNDENYIEIIQGLRI